MEAQLFAGDVVASPTILVEPQTVLGTGRFVALCVATLGIYGLWWQYKAWRFFKQWEQNGTWPAVRVICCLFTIHSLLRRIGRLAQHAGVPGGFSPALGAVGYLGWSLLGRLPDPMWLVAMGAFGFLVPAVRTFGQTLPRLAGVPVQVASRFNGRQRLLLGLGGVFWGALLGSFLLVWAA